MYWTTKEKETWYTATNDHWISGSPLGTCRYRIKLKKTFCEYCMAKSCISKIYFSFISTCWSYWILPFYNKFLFIFSISPLMYDAFSLIQFFSVMVQLYKMYINISVKVKSSLDTIYRYLLLNQIVVNRLNLHLSIYRCQTLYNYIAWANILTKIASKSTKVWVNMDFYNNSQCVFLHG